MAKKAAHRRSRKAHRRRSVTPITVRGVRFKRPTRSRKSWPPRGYAVPRSARKRFRRNPARGGRVKLVSLLMQGGKDAVAIVAGKAGARVLPNLLVQYVPQVAGLPAIAIQVGAAVAVGYLVQKVVGPSVARLVLAGALAAPIESFVKGAGIPVVSAALAGDDMTELPLASYPEALAAYPDMGETAGIEMGDDADEAYLQQ